jgi:hypothetical protein
VPRKVGNVEDFFVFVSEREGGVMIRYEDEDPEIRRNFVDELSHNNVQCAMPSPGEIRSNTVDRAAAGD